MIVDFKLPENVGENYEILLFRNYCIRQDNDCSTTFLFFSN